MSNNIKTTSDLRSAFISYFEGKGHANVESAHLLALNDPTLMFVNSGMVQFKDMFLGVEKRSYNKATTFQKCLRVSGKHNDFEEVGKTRRHHTFFEMLGNFSFGDYFKIDAIKYAWEFTTEVIKLDKSKLWVTIHKNDDNALEYWKANTDISPDRIVKLGDDSNLWSAGEVGPWGYCSELFYYMGDENKPQSKEEFLKDDGTYLEFWNLVFMEFFKDESGKSEKLPLQCIDTGMGLERTASILQGKNSNYDIDSLREIISVIEGISKVAYVGDCYNSDGDNGTYPDYYKLDVAMRVITDHCRSACFLIADGVSPGNEGPEYVLRRLIRRALRHATALEIKEPFLKTVAEKVISVMGSSYPSLVKSSALILELINKEELQFRKTLSSGLSMINKWLSESSGKSTLPGDVAFKLYDTYGFPLDLTEDYLQERGIAVDSSGFAQCMEEQRERSRQGAKAVVNTKIDKELLELKPTIFEGFNVLELDSQVFAAIELKNKNCSNVAIISESSPFYGEKGGQCGDTGQIVIDNKTFAVNDAVYISPEVIAHIITPSSSEELQFLLDSGKEKSSCRLIVDAVLRAKISINHSATHLLNSALRKVLGDHVQQRGSFVNSVGLRFDFSHFKAIEAEELNDIFQFVNENIRANYQCKTEELGIAEAKAKGALAFFGDKYGDTVRMVDLGPDSLELCGGTHVNRTGDIGSFAILNEGSISSGTRRVECIAGHKADLYRIKQETIIKSLGRKLKSPSEKITEKIDKLIVDQKSLKQQLKATQEKLAISLAREIVEGYQRSGSSKKFLNATIKSSEKDLVVLVTDEVINQLNTANSNLELPKLVNVGSEDIGIIFSKKVAKMDKDFHVGNFIKPIIQEHNVKGGGNAQNATIVGLNKDSFNLFISSLSE